MEYFKRYFHTMIEKYQDELDKLSVAIKKTNTGYTLSKREKRFKELKPKIEKEFEKFKGVFLLVQIESDYFKQNKRKVFWNAFQINYDYRGYDAGIKIELIDTYTNKLVDVSMNCYILKTYNKEVKFKKILEDCPDKENKDCPNNQ